jgi:hypothetical protein
VEALSGFLFEPPVKVFDLPQQTCIPLGGSAYWRQPALRAPPMA